MPGISFELEDFGGTARQAVDSAIRQIAAEMLPDSVEQTMGTYEISAEAEVTVTDSLVTYIISRWSFTGGAHGMYGMECHTYSLAGGDELSSADLFSGTAAARHGNPAAQETVRAIRSRQRRRAGRSGILPGIHLPYGEFPGYARRDHVLLQPLMISDAMHWGPSK